ncbi:hypothetical protein ACIQSO_01125 [Pseudomonas putida]|uniref:hypothetical protein n=1 Tax=Pseudomonas putida TaxID=303 RepID=UPI00383A3F48
MAAAQGLDMHQMEVQDNTLRLKLTGDAQTLLKWIHSAEQSGATLLSLTLHKRDQILDAQIVVQAPRGG